MRKQIVVVAIAMAIVFTAGCQKYQGQQTTTQSYDGDRVIEHDLTTLDEIRSTSSQVITEAQEGKWKNLIFEKFTPYITDGDEIYNVNVKTPDSYKNLKGEELLDAELSFMEGMIGDFSNGLFRNVMSYIQEGEYSDTVIQEFRDKIRSGKYDDVYEIMYPDIVFKKNKIKEGNYAPYIATNAKMQFQMYNKKIVNTKMDDIMARGEEPPAQVPGLNIWYLDIIDTIYAGADDGSLDKEYQLLDGKLSVRDGIKFIEDYVNTKMPYETNPDIKASVYAVYVMPVTDDIYCYHFRMRRSIYGLVTEAGWPSMTGVTGYLAESADAEIILSDEVDELADQRLIDNTEKTGDVITEIIPMDAAIDIVSSEIGDNSTYKVYSLELGYDIKDIQGDGVPVWRFEVENVNTEETRFFFVDAVTGKVYTRVW